MAVLDQFEVLGTTYDLQDTAAQEDITNIKADLSDVNAFVNGDSIYNSASIGSTSSIGTIWNFYHDVNIPSGAVIEFCVDSYSGSLLSSARILAYKSDDTYDVLTPAIKGVGVSIAYTTTNSYVKLNVQIIRSATENSVTGSYHINIYKDGSDLRTHFHELIDTMPMVDVEITDDVLFYNVGYYFSTDGKTIENAGTTPWVISDYIPVGLGITVTGSAHSAYRPQIVEYDAKKNFVGMQKLEAIGSVTKTYTPDMGVAYVRLQSTISTGNIASGTQKVIEPVPKVYHVEKDGSGDYTNLADAIAEATRRMDAVVYVGAGTWNILDELGDDYLANISATKQGIVLKNRVHVICSSKAYIKCLYSGSNANVINYLSAFNAGKNGFMLENADIEVANVRYCVHDERNAEGEQYNNYYLNCRMKNTNQTSGSRGQCIGGGLGYDGHIVIDGCTFENPLRENYGVVSYHNAHGAATDSRSLIEVKGCYFKGTNTFRAGYYGNATVMTQCLVHGNSMGAEPYVAQEDSNYSNVNMEIVAWNNEIRSV